jgi:Leucine-rich repeat (LRR) protein
MKKLLLLLFLGFTLVGFSQTTLIPDPNFEQALIDLGYDTAPINGSVPTANISNVTVLYVSDKNITDLTGIEDFTDLNFLNCGLNQLTSLDVSNNTALSYFNCQSNQLTSLDVSNNSALENLWCGFNELTSLDVSNNSALENLWCGFNELTSLDVSNNTALTSLSPYFNELISLDVSNNNALTYLSIQNNQLTSIDVSNNAALDIFYCTNNQITNLDVSNTTVLSYLNCSSNQLTSLDIRNGNNTHIVIGVPSGLRSGNNPNLSCIFVDNAAYSTANWPDIDPNSTFVENEAECALSVGDNVLELDVFIYPNPTNDYLFIEGNKNPIAVSIYNLLGAEVIANSNTDKINVSELSKGIYIIRISDGVNQTNKRFIKN